MIGVCSNGLMMIGSTQMGLATNGSMTVGAETRPNIPRDEDASELSVPGSAPVDSDVDGIERSSSSPELSLDSWRIEVAARLERYRTRRKPKSPRYPSLLLPFDAPDSRSRVTTSAGAESAGGRSAALAAAPAQEEDFIAPERQRAASADSARVADAGLESQRFHERVSDRITEPSAKLIEFPRSAAIPVFHPRELAEPIFDRPRIVEAPEVLPPPPALGGILIEPTHPQSESLRTDPSLGAIAALRASTARRMLAMVVDGAILATSLAAFGAVFWRLNPVRVPWPLLAGALSGVAILQWMVYEFLFVVYTGATPGMRAARLRLGTFAGVPLNRRTRRWRALASFLSAFSAGLGYFWCVLDPDGLCWHDRITRSCVQPSKSTEQSG